MDVDYRRNCYNCGRFGHIARNYRNRRIERQERRFECGNNLNNGNSN